MVEFARDAFKVSGAELSSDFSIGVVGRESGRGGRSEGLPTPKGDVGRLLGS